MQCGFWRREALPLLLCGLPNRLMGRSVLHVRGDRASSPVPRSPVLRTADQSREPWRSWRGRDRSREGGGAAQAVTERGHIRAYRGVPLFPAELFLQSEARENDGGRRCCPSTIRTQDWKYRVPQSLESLSAWQITTVFPHRCFVQAPLRFVCFVSEKKKNLQKVQ